MGEGCDGGGADANEEGEALTIDTQSNIKGRLAAMTKKAPKRRRSSSEGEGVGREGKQKAVERTAVNEWRKDT